VANLTGSVDRARTSRLITSQRLGMQLRCGAACWDLKRVRPAVPVLSPYLGQRFRNLDPMGSNSDRNLRLSKI